MGCKSGLRRAPRSPTAAAKSVGFITLAFFSSASSALARGGVFLQQSNGVVAIQMESTTAPTGWSRSTATAGYTGDAYFQWIGSNNFFNGGIGTFGFVGVPAGQHMEVVQHNTAVQQAPGGCSIIRQDLGTEP